MSKTARPAMDERTNRYRLTVEQYHRMGDAGIIPDGARVELLDGEVFEMSPIGSRHAACLRRLSGVFADLRDRAAPSAQNPVVLPGGNEPVPDFALLRPRDDDYAAGHPGAEDVLLLVEVADTSLARDRIEKSRIYARHGIREYWFVDLAGDRIEVRRRPDGDDSGESRIHRRGETIAPAAFPDHPVPVDAILPPPPA